MSADQREADAEAAIRLANASTAYTDSSTMREQADLMRRLAAYARAPLAPPTEAEVEAFSAVLLNHPGWPEGDIGRHNVLTKVRGALIALFAERNRA